MSSFAGLTACILVQVTPLKVLIIPRAIWNTLVSGYEKEMFKVFSTLLQSIENDLVIDLQDAVDLNLQLQSPLASALAPWLREGELHETIKIPDRIMKELMGRSFLLLPMNESYQQLTAFYLLTLHSSFCSWYIHEEAGEG